ncbi:MAG: ketoacyl-ACP synthase III [Bacteroidales bacterium]|nr:ketoacyl-ACP synthase III [Bacteroidales bacterium]
MAFLEIKNVRIAGIASGVPKNVEYTKDNPGISGDYNYEDFIKSTGVEQRRVDDIHTTSDLCCAAAEKLIEDLGWDKKDIEAVIFVTQGPDYIAPATACIVQDRLGLSKECYASEISLGCSGWVYGLSQTAALMTSGCIKKALLMAGDAKFVLPVPDPLASNAGTVTALEYDEGNEGFKFHFGTDGSGWDAIYIPDGGARNGVSQDSFKMEDVNGRQICRLQSHMNGMDVFAFAISTAPKSIMKTLEHYGISLDEIDYCILHQANMQIDEIIRGKLKLQPEKVPYSLHKFGNTSSATIPITINTELRGKIENKVTRFVGSGFGVGLSWGTVLFSTENIVLSEIVEI